MNRTLADLAHRHLVAENQQDLTATLVTLHPECRFDDFATGQTCPRHEGAPAHYRQCWTTFDVEVKREPGQVSAWTADDVCMAEATWHGRHIGRFLGIEPTGRTIVQPFVVVLGFRDGLMVSERFHYDLNALLRQIGGPALPALDELPYRRAA